MKNMVSAPPPPPPSPLTAWPYLASHRLTTMGLLFTHSSSEPDFKRKLPLDFSNKMQFIDFSPLVPLCLVFSRVTCCFVRLFFPWQTVMKHSLEDSSGCNRPTLCAPSLRSLAVHDLSPVDLCRWAPPTLPDHCRHHHHHHRHYHQSPLSFLL